MPYPHAASWVDSIQVRSECPLPPISQSPPVSDVFASFSVLFLGSKGFYPQEYQCPLPRLT
ncbi:hypothetical protein E2C01_014818 [Portunus trituberculatus]|uniref:Uncharacterized protein n=1 Tax=Portunus trituberculatus TaxID=210409 RepID=A0A5B7DK70_PORTR|nr:hypothetical protein [Portunus trituberculatus]